MAQKLGGHTFTVPSRFQPRRILGTGSYGVVCSAYDAQEDTHIALKRVRPMAADEWDARHTLREIRLMRILAFHPNIISTFGLCVNEAKEELYILLELMDCDLQYLINTGQTLTETHLKCFLKQMLEGLKAMHSLKILHRDLKPANILVSKDCRLRITDFGLARYMDDETQQGRNESNPMTEYVVTRWYRAPELLLASNFQYTAAIDMWSIGCIFAELIKRSPLFPGKAHAHQVQVILQILGTVEPSTLGFPIDDAAARFLKRQSYAPVPLHKLLPGADATAINLIERSLIMNPNRRLTVQAALAHPYLSDAPEMYDYSSITVPEQVDESLFAFEQQQFTLQGLKALIKSEVSLASCRGSACCGCPSNSTDTTTAAPPQQPPTTQRDKLAESCASTVCTSSISEDASVVSVDEMATARQFGRMESAATEDMHFRRSHDSQSEDHSQPDTVQERASETRSSIAEPKPTRPALTQASANNRSQAQERPHQQRLSKATQRARAASRENLPAPSRRSSGLRSNSEHAVAVKVENLRDKEERRHTSVFERLRRRDNEEVPRDEPVTRIRLPRILSRIFSDNNLRRQQPLR